MGRLHHLSQVYEQNIKAALSYSNVEFVLLDYHSPDQLGAWVKSAFPEWLESGILRYFRTTEPVLFHMAHAKNVAHRLAQGEVLVNLDADNSFRQGFAEEIATLFANDARVIAKFSDYYRGCSGRIALRRDDFYRIGGYDEEMIGWGYEDQDLIARARSLGLELRSFEKEHALVIQHEDKERVRFSSDKNKQKSDARNRALSQMKIAGGRLAANAGREWGTARIDACSERAHWGKFVKY